MNYSNKWSTDRLMSIGCAEKKCRTHKFWAYIICVTLFCGYFGAHAGLAVYKYYQSTTAVKEQKVDYSDYEYKDPFGNSELTARQHYAFNYAVARRYLIQEINAHPEWTAEDIKSASKQLGDLFHVKHLSTKPLTKDEKKELVDVYYTLAKRL